MQAHYEKWFWIDLIGFDRERPDCAVPDLFERAGFIPPAVSLLLHNAEFVHGHAQRGDTEAFPHDVCSYGGHERNEERTRQPWTPRDLRRLVRVLQEHGSKVLFSIFDSGTPAGWREHHPELGYTLADGSRSPRICPWKRLADGTAYEDVLAPHLQRVMRDYGFDGFHGADGYSHPRFPLHQADFSDDMIDQFAAAMPLCLPATITDACDGKTDAIVSRAQWIWTHRRQEWIDFHVQRIARFWRKLAAMLHAEGKQLILNSCWTRDPFEATCRYGVDYRRLAEAGADAFVVEAAGAVQELGGDLPFGSAYGRTYDSWDPTRILCRFQTTIMQIKAAVPHTKLVFLNGIKDTNEIWNGLRHAPTNVESEITMHANVFIRHGNGRPKRCVDGLTVCLADGIRTHEWRWLNSLWERAFSPPAQRLIGATVLWSDTLATGQIADFLASRRCPYGRLLFDLAVRGAPLYGIQRVDDLGDTDEPLLLLHPQLCAAAEIEHVFASARGPLLLLGAPLPGRRESVSFTLREPVAGLTFTGYNLTPDCCPAWSDSAVATAHEEKTDWPEPPSWIYDLPSVPLAQGFLQACADTLIAAAAAPRVLENACDVRVWAVEITPGMRRLFIRNDAFYYRVALVDLGRSIRSIEVRTEFPGSPIVFRETRFHVKVPGKGIIIADITV